ncbi:Protein CBG21963 [Caenorhabditis briggsae]|uniref:Protein CBG21963 n=1 Tax=Caenorhabditis briggsae TaxID=6238 RepID=A8Y144_CAEBR|nr:Protein CBG21963 [Caenorhabditis briggsae]CAP38605.2 Protein CBG21963 [Caenorhabditis briggsae]
MANMSKQTSNVVWVSLNMMVLFTAILSHEFIMEPLLHAYASRGTGGIQEKDGYLALCIVYAFNAVGCFVAPWLVTRISGKWSMVVGICTLFLYEFAYLFPNRISILSISCIVGIGTTFLWVGQGQYISENVSDNNREKNTSMQWAFFKMSLVFGGLFFLGFFHGASIESLVDNGQTHISGIILASLLKIGANSTTVIYITFTELAISSVNEKTATRLLSRLPTDRVQIFVIFFMILTILASISTCFLPQTDMSQDRAPEPFLRASANFIKQLRQKRILLLSTFFFYTGISRSFWISIYPACIKFTSRLSSNTTTTLALGMVVTGVGQVAGSLAVTASGRRVRKLGEHAFIILALIIHIVLFVMISLSFPNDAPLGHTKGTGPVFDPTVSMTMTMSFLLGFGDAILQTQVYAYIAKYYQKESGSVFSCFRFFAGIASTIMFFVAQFFNLAEHLCILIIGACAAGIAIVLFHQSVNRSYQQKTSVVVVSVMPTARRTAPQNAIARVEALT